MELEAAVQCTIERESLARELGSERLVHQLETILNIGEAAEYDAAIMVSAMKEAHAVQELPLQSIKISQVQEEQYWSR